MEFSSAQQGAFRTSQNFKPQASADNIKEDADVQKLFTHESNEPLGFSAIVVAMALLSFAAMIGVRMRRRMQPAIALAGSSGHGIDMSTPLATVSADNTLDLKSHCHLVRNPEQSWDPLGLGKCAPKAHVKNFRESELQHGQVATMAVFFVSAAAAGSTNKGDVPPHVCQSVATKPGTIMAEFET